jgi:signal transduction histidine kinase
MPAPAPPPAATGDSQIDAAWVASALGTKRSRRSRLPAFNTRHLLWLALLGAGLLAMWLTMLAGAAHLPLVWRAAPGGAIELDASTEPALRDSIGQRLAAVVLVDGQRITAGAALLPRSPRWIIDDDERDRAQALRTLVSRAVDQPTLTLAWQSGTASAVAPRPRGLGGLGAMCWLMVALAIGLSLAAAVVVLSTPGLPAALYALMAMAQAVNLLLIGAEAMPGMGLPGGLVRFDLGLRLLTDAVTAASLLHLMLIYPRRLPQAARLVLPVWGLALAAVGWALRRPPAGLWWWAQGLTLAYSLAAVVLPGWSRHRQGSPLADMLQRLILAGAGTLLLLSIAMALASRDGLAQYAVATVGTAVWAMFFATLVMLAPFLSNARPAQRELAILAGACSVTCSLDLLLEAAFALSPLASLLLALTGSLLVYRAARSWILHQLAGPGTLSAERMFDSLYRVARELEQTPEQVARHLGGLLREVFDPLEVARTGKPVSRIRVALDGSTLVVPIPVLAGDGAGPPSGPHPGGAIVLRFARRGQRLFTHEDLQLAERLIEQLRGAVAYDRAVEHGRTEERTRIAQDLHDDIGARLLTLMYKAQDSEVEEYIRHTLQDLKTLTRGLAAGNHRLSHAAAEWKSDITGRLAATGCDLHWSHSADRDILLTVVQWSGLTRVLRELVNNIITHAQASQVDISVHVDRGLMTLIVSDDGIGRAPETWSHGLGLGGVRKRVKLLGGRVEWAELPERGIRCEVRATLSGEAGRP